MVASCGTALTPQQAQLLRRFTSKVVLSFDPDAAGQGAAVRSCELLVAEGFDVNVVVLDKGEDPDTFIRQQGRRPVSRAAAQLAAVSGVPARSGGRRARLRATTTAAGSSWARCSTVAARIPDAAARDQFADRIAHKARITEEVVRAEIRKAAVSRRTTVTTRELPAFGQLKQAEKGLIWGLIHNTGEALEALAELDDEDLEESGRPRHPRGGPEPARRAAGPLTIGAFAASKYSERPARHEHCRHRRLASPARRRASARIKRLRWERERAAIQREIDRLQELGATQHGHEIDTLWQRKKDLLHRIEELT